MMRTLILTHRYVGIATCLLFVMWFGSGVVMMYVGFPQLTAAERFEGLAPLDLRTAHVLPSQALAAADVDGWPREMRLEMVLGRPISSNHGKDRGAPFSRTTGRCWITSSRPRPSLPRSSFPASHACAILA